MRRFEPKLLAPLFALMLSLGFVVTPASSYIVFLKDGKQISTKEKYRVEGDKAYLILPSGTEAVYPAAEIDVAKTDEVNTVDYGTAILIGDHGEEQQLSVDTRFEEEEQKLSDLARQRRKLSGPKQATRPVATEPTEPTVPTTLAGHIDLLAWPRQPFSSEEIRLELQRYLKGQGLENVSVYSGTESDRPLVEIIANSEASVFKALKDSANALVQVRDRFPQEVAALEICMVTENQLRAGQFLITPKRANLLVTGAMSSETFFLRYVEF